MKSQDPLVERDLARLHYSVYSDRELLSAFVALNEPLAVGFALKTCGVFGVTMRADKAIGPANTLKVTSSVGFSHSSNFDQVHTLIVIGKVCFVKCIMSHIFVTIGRKGRCVKGGWLAYGTCQNLRQ